MPLIPHFMKKLFLLISIFGYSFNSFSQIDTLTAPATSPAPVTPNTSQAKGKVKKDWSKVDLGNRSNDHLMIQVGYDKWAGKPDSIKTKGFSRSINAYFMLDFPFKTDPRFSVGLGAGISGSSTYFDKTIVEIAGSGTKLDFNNVADTSYFKKFKLTNVFAEVPIELRFTADPEHNSKSWKFVVGAKIGTMLNAHTKGKTLLSKSGSTINAYTRKENSKRYFNSTRLAGTARIGIGVFSIFGVYQINPFLKEGAGPDIHPYTVGIGISGL